MMVHIVSKKWMGGDDRPISEASVEGVFSSPEKARAFMFKETGDEDALKYGLLIKDNYRWSMREVAVR